MKTRSSEVGHALEAFDQMDQMIADMLDWADVLVALGVGPHKVEPGAMRLIGHALNDLAGDLRCRWDVVDARKEMMR
jgi:hypothetical protein